MTKTTKKAVKPAKKATAKKPAAKKATKTTKASKKAVSAGRGRKAVYAKKPLAAMNQAEKREYWREGYRRRMAKKAEAK